MNYNNMIDRATKYAEGQEWFYSNIQIICIVALVLALVIIVLLLAIFINLSMLHKIRLDTTEINYNTDKTAKLCNAIYKINKDNISNSQ